MDHASTERYGIPASSPQGPRPSRLQDLALLWFYILVAGIAMSGWLWLLGSLCWRFAGH
jgi:hypothetical protein